MSGTWNRRKLVSALAVGSAAVAASGCAHTAEPPRTPRIGFIIGDVPDLIAAFDEEIVRLGYVEGRNIHIERRYPRANSSEAQSFSAELAAADLDLVVASALPFALLVRDANPNMPMVIAFGPGLLSNGFAETMERPGGIVTGVDELPPGITTRRLELLKTAAPGVTKVGLLSTTPGVGGHETQATEAEATAGRLGVAVKTYRAANLTEIQAALDAMITDGMEGLMSFQGGLAVANARTIVEFAAAHRMPAIYQSEIFVNAGGLMSWAPDQPEQMRVAARYVDRILRGARPGDLPILYPERYYLTLNRAAAERIGLALPPSLLSSADRVV